MTVRHGFVSSVVDIGGPTYIQPTHWNAPHNMPPIRLFNPNIPGYATNGASIGIPSSASWGQLAVELTDTSLIPGTGAQRGAYDFTYVEAVRLFAGRASNANTGAVSGGSVALLFQYMASGFPGSWYSFDGSAGSAPFISLATGNNGSIYLASTNGLMYSASVAVPSFVRAMPQPLTIRLAAKGGNGSAIQLTDAFVLGY